MKELQQQFQRVAAKAGLDMELEPGCFAVRSETAIGVNQVIETILAFGGEQGWLTTQDCNLMLEEWRTTPQRCGAVLHAELVKGKCSLHVRQAREGWLITRLEELEAGGEPCLVEQRNLVSTRNEKERLIYRIYWQTQPGLGFRATHFRFAGFQGAVA